MMVNRNLRVDTLRGIACIFLVAYHVVGYDSSSGLRLDQGIYREINDLLVYIRMPLFTFLSGIVYAYRPFSGGVKRFIGGKVRRLLIPMLVVGTAFALLQLATPGANSGVEDWRLLHIMPVAHYWFIEAIFLIFMLIIPLELLSLFKHKIGFFIVLAVAIAIYLYRIYIPYFSISGAMYLLPYFLLGMGLERFLLSNQLSKGFGVVLLLIVGLSLLLIALDPTPPQSMRTVLGLTLGTAACVGLLALRVESKLLAGIGIYSYSIYLYHVFFTAGARIAFAQLPFENNLHVVFAASLLAGIAGSIVAEKLFDKTNVSRLLLLGKSRIPKPRSLETPLNRPEGRTP